LQVLTQTYNPSAVRQLKRVLRAFQPDLVHARMILYQLSPAILPSLSDYPAIYQAAMYRAICPIGTRVLPDGSDCTHIAGRVCLKEGCVTPQSWALLMLQRMLWQRGRGVFSRYVALSHVMRETLEAGGLSPVMVIHNGVPERAKRAPLSGPPRVIYAGRLAPEKGVDLLLRAFAVTHRAVPAATLDIIGDGPLRSSLRELTESLQLTAHVRFLGHLTREQMEAECDSAWVQVVPSQWHEPFGNVSTEAMMRGTAVVASDVGGQRDIVRHEETGRLVPAHDEHAWTRAMTTLLTDRPLAERYGAAGRARALASFSERACLDQWEALYDEVIAERRRTTAVTEHA
jgi:glycosyltransferase involved in cell wall biosynthesis